MTTCFSAPILLIYRLQDTTGCNINPSYYQNTTIYIQYLPSRLFFVQDYIFKTSFQKPDFKQKIERLNTSEYLGKILLGFEDVIKNIASSKRLFQKLHFKLISLVTSDNFAIVICHTISSLEVNEGKGEGESPPSVLWSPKKPGLIRVNVQTFYTLLFL